jgi:hypothetical protein
METVTEEVRQLVAGAADGTLDGEGKAALCRALDESEDARRYYLRYMQVAAQLEELGATSDDVEFAVSELRQSKVRRIWGIVAVAAVLALVGLVIMRGTDKQVEVVPEQPIAQAPPETPEPVAPVPSDGPLTLAAIEISGSMTADGREFEPVVHRVFEELSGLSAGDAFNLVAFATDRELFQPQAVAATPDNLAAAREWIMTKCPDLGESPEWPSDDWQDFEDGEHFGADLLATMSFCFEKRPDRIIYATDWVGDPGSVHVSKQELIESIRDWQRERETQATLDVVVYKPDGHNRFLRRVASDNGGRFLEAVR